MKLKEFRCMICQKTRERGVMVKLGKLAGRYTGTLVKVCKSARCKILAKKGELENG